MNKDRKEPRQATKLNRAAKDQWTGTIEPIPDTPRNIARAIMKGPPKKEWRFLNKPDLTKK